MRIQFIKKLAAVIFGAFLLGGYQNCDQLEVATKATGSAENLNDQDRDSDSTSDIEKPYGAFTSKATSKSLVHPESLGALIRTNWSSIEPKKGSFDFSDIDSQINEMYTLLGEDYGEKKFSLAIAAGCGQSPQSTGYPSWLHDLGVETMPVVFRGNDFTLPKMWDKKVQERLKILAEALADKYGDDDRLVLVYIPQLTGNGIEGHFNSTDSSVLISNGLSEDNWVSAAKEVSVNFAQAFKNKALAFEVHEVVGSSNIPKRIINELYQDERTQKRVGVAVWWLSGGVGYQPELLEAIKDFPGDKYAQVIGNSSQPCRFGDNSEDYKYVFYQAIDLGVRYIEPWNYEFDNNTQNENLEKFNLYSYQKYVLGENPSIPEFSTPIGDPGTYCD